MAENGAYELTVIDNSLYGKFENWLEKYTQGSLYSSSTYIPFEPTPSIKLYVDGTLHDVDVAVAYSTDELPGISGACVISTDASGGWSIAEGLKYSSNDRGIWVFEPANTPSINKMAVFFENPDNYDFQVQEI